jgi:hypothetical protein
MKPPRTNQIAKLAGCLSFVALFPLCIVVSVWVAFAIGPMSCALPNRCSRSEETVKGVLSILVLLGGGIGIPIVVASLVEKGLKTGSKILSDQGQKSEKENNE